MYAIFAVFSEETRRRVAALPPDPARPRFLLVPDYVPCDPLGACCRIEWGSRLPFATVEVLTRQIASRRRRAEPGTGGERRARLRPLIAEFTRAWDDGLITDLAAALGVTAPDAALMKEAA